MYPVLFKVPLLGWEIYSFGVLLALSLLVAWLLVHWLAGNEGFPRETVGDAFVITALGGVLGARLHYVLTNIEDFANPIEILRVSEGGLTAYGGLIGGTLAGWLYMRRKRLSTWGWLDALTPPVTIGVVLTRIGCFLHGCDFGRVAEDLDIAVRFPQGSPAFEWHDRLRWLVPGADASLPVHPVQLYWAGAGVLLLGVSIAMWRFRRSSGQVFLTGMLAYSCAAFVTEVFRGDPGRGWLWAWSGTQAIAMLAAVAALGAYVLRWRTCRRDPSAAFYLGEGIDAARARDAAARDSE